VDGRNAQIAAIRRQRGERVKPTLCGPSTSAAARAGDTLVVPKLDQLARSVPDARAIANALIARGVKLALLGSSVYDPADPMGKMFFNILATFAVTVRGRPPCLGAESSRRV